MDTLCWVDDDDVIILLLFLLLFLLLLLGLGRRGRLFPAVRRRRAMSRFPLLLPLLLILILLILPLSDDRRIMLVPRAARGFLLPHSHMRRRVLLLLDLLRRPCPRRELCKWQGGLRGQGRLAGDHPLAQ